MDIIDGMRLYSMISRPSQNHTVVLEQYSCKYYVGPYCNIKISKIQVSMEESIRAFKHEPLTQNCKE